MARHSVWLYERISRPAIRRTAALVFLGVAGLLVYADTRKIVIEERFGAGPHTLPMPVGAADFIEREGIPGDFFNEFNFGGYLAGRFYPERRVYIDGRGLAYPQSHFERVRENPFLALEGQMRDFPRATVAVVERRPGELEYGIAFEALGWRPVYLDRNAFVFVRPGSEAERAGMRHELRVMRFWRTDEGLFNAVRSDPARAIEELRILSGRDFRSPYDFYRLAQSAHVAGDDRLAEAFFRKGMAINPGHAKLYEEYRRFRADAERNPGG